MEQIKLAMDNPSTTRITTPRVKQEGMKFDDDKLDYTLLPWDAMDEVVRVLMAGEKKYARDNWKLVDNAKFRYLKAAFRHLIAYAQHPTQNDPETGLSHLGHCICCLLFILSLTRTTNKD